MSVAEREVYVCDYCDTVICCVEEEEPTQYGESHRCNSCLVMKELYCPKCNYVVGKFQPHNIPLVEQIHGHALEVRSGD